MKYIALFTITLSIIGCILYFQNASIQTSYWLWAGVTASDVPPDSELYVYQGLITHKENAITYQRIGLYPHPLKGRKIFLVYRLEGTLPNTDAVVSIFINGVKQWQRHPLVITGLQLDFDSPTSKLLMYGDFLKKMRQALPKNYALSVTGLGDWAIYGDKQAISTIVHSTDELVFQLYQGWKPLPNIDSYIDTLSNYSLSFRVGLLAGANNASYIHHLKKNPNFKGVIYFIQKHHETLSCFPHWPSPC